MGWFFHREILPSLTGPPVSLLDIGLPEAGGEEWLGIFYGGEQAGYSHTFFSPSREEPGGTRLENTIHLDLPLLGRTTRVQIRTFGRIDPEGGIVRLTVSASSSSPPLAVEALLAGDQFTAEITTGKEKKKISFALPRPALPAYLFAAFLPRQDLREGETFSLPVLDPLSGLHGESLRTGSVRFQVIETTEEGYRLRAEYGGMSAELDLDSKGKVREITTYFGWSLKRQTLAEVMNFLQLSQRDLP